MCKSDEEVDAFVTSDYHGDGSSGFCFVICLTSQVPPAPLESTVPMRISLTSTTVYIFFCHTSIQSGANETTC